MLSVKFPGKSSFPISPEIKKNRFTEMNGTAIEKKHSQKQKGSIPEQISKKM